jgi:hypothetical protein
MHPPKLLRPVGPKASTAVATAAGAASRVAGLVRLPPGAPIRVVFRVMLVGSDLRRCGCGISASEAHPPSEL